MQRKTCSNSLKRNMIQILIFFMAYSMKKNLMIFFLGNKVKSYISVIYSFNKQLLLLMNSEI